MARIITLNLDFIIMAIISLKAILTVSLASSNTNCRYATVCQMTREKEWSFCLFVSSQSTIFNQCRCPYRILSIKKQNKQIKKKKTNQIGLK